MKRIWAPWRIEYIKSEKAAGCFLCDNPKQDRDAANYLLYRGKHNFIIMNRYPYNPDHLLVAPYRHIATPEELNEAERLEHYNLIVWCVTVLREHAKPAGFNIGMNLGRAAGAGVDDHIHSHIVPRWNGDTNFMPMLADVRVLPQALDELYEELKDKFKNS
jgi:ATP adenylyltransferase